MTAARAEDAAHGGDGDEAASGGGAQDSEPERRVVRFGDVPADDVIPEAQPSTSGTPDSSSGAAADDDVDAGWPWSFLLLVAAGAIYLIVRFVEIAIDLLR